MADSSLSSSELIDRLSNLPEHILHHILSFLPTRDAVATSVLSKPWQLLWTLVPTIDLDDPTYYHYNDSSSDDSSSDDYSSSDDDSSSDDGSSNDGFYQESVVKTFEQSVSKVLDSNKSPIIRRFCLKGKRCKTSSLDKWLSSAAERNVEELDLTFRSQSISSSRTVAFWSATKSFKTLVVMKLTMDSQCYDNSQFVFNIGENLDCYFPTLKVLHLYKVWFQGGDASLSGIFGSRFPLLEELIIRYGGKFHHDINISLPKLRRFDICCESLEPSREVRLNMEAPSLQCLVLRDFGSGSRSFLVENLHSLLDASLSSRFPLLEELVIITATFHHDINISLPKLRRLEIYHPSSGTLRKYTLNIEAPSLQYLDLSSFENVGVRVEGLPNLVEANVDVVYKMRDDKYYVEYGESLINFVNALFNVGRLNLSSYTMWELHIASSRSFFHADRIQPFRNLVKLDLELLGSVLGIAMIMLSKFENLEHLKITDITPEYQGRKTEYSLAPPTRVPNCLTYHLKTFCFEKFKCSKYEMELAIYILKNSLVLENTKILLDRGQVWKKGHYSKTILSTISRGSVECQLEFDQNASEY